MATEKFTNDGSTTVSAGGTTAPVAGTAETWTVASSASFPALAAGEQFHVADPAAATEIIAVTAVSGTTWTVTRGAESTTPVAHTAGFTVQNVITAGALGAFQQAVIDTAAADFQPDGTAAAGATGKLADAGHVHPYQPWRFAPESYGAVGDGQVTADVATTSGSGAITSVSGPFTAADVGKHIMINGGNGAAAAPLITTIASYQSATQVTLTATAGATAAGCSAVWGTDDTAAINAAVSAAKTYALANGYFAEVVFAGRIYVLAAAPTQTSTPAVQNAQVLLPYPDVTGATRKLVIALTGAGNAGAAQFWESTVPDLAGSCLVSMQTAPSTPDVTFGRQSVIGGPSGGGAFTGSYANAKAVLAGLSVWCPAYTNMLAYDFGYLAGVHVDACSAQVFAPAAAGTSPLLKDLPAQVAFQSTAGIGARFPLVGNNDDVTVPSFAAEGFETGLWMADHFTGGRLVTVYTDLAALIDLVNGISSNSHAVTIANWSAEAFNGALKSNGGSGRCQVDILLDAETTGGADPSYDVSDSGGTLYGQLRWGDPGRTSARPVISGAANLRVVNGRLGPGHWAAAPAVPASTVAQQNTAWRDAAVTVTGGTVTAIAVDGQSTGLTSGTVFVPAGKTITLTYSAAPSWQWVLA